MAAGSLEERDGGVIVNAGDRRAVNIISESRERTASGRVAVAPLWAGEKRPPPNYEAALKDWRRTRKYLLEQGLYGEYLAVFEKWLQRGYIEQVDVSLAKDGFFLPHFPVVRSDNLTTKVRVVANGAARFDGVSLNDCMLPGPKLLNSLVQVLLRFRRKRVAITADIEHKFLRVVVPEPDRQYHRFVFSNAAGATVTYQATGHVFGSAGSLTIAVAVLKLAALENEGRWPLAAAVMARASMVDNVLETCNDVGEAAALCTELVELCASVGMNLHKWCTNEPTVLPDGEEQREALEIVDKAQAPGEEHKPLGVVWRPAEDSFSFRYTKAAGAGPWTKLEVLKLYMSLFDPLGVLLPFVMSARILYRDLWDEGCDWDEHLSEEAHKDWASWFAQLPDLALVKFNRCIDASQDGYGAACYVYGGGRSVLVYAKGQVNANRARTIPVLELLGAEIGVMLAREAARALDYELREVDFFVDSQPVLSWIRAPSRALPAHAGRKVAQIREATNPANWSYVPTGENPADLLSRGTSLRELANCTLWWEGPSFITSGV